MDLGFEPGTSSSFEREGLGEFSPRPTTLERAVLTGCARSVPDVEKEVTTLNVINSFPGCWCVTGAGCPSVDDIDSWQ